MRTTTELNSLKGIDTDMLDSPAPPAYAAIYGNIGYGCDTFVADRTLFIFNRNRFIITNGKNKKNEGSCASLADGVYRFGSVYDNIGYSSGAESIFVDPANGNFFLKEDSQVYRDIIGFEKWDYSLIGIRK